MERDAFARTEIVRESVAGTCDYRGGQRHRNGKPMRFGVFAYTIEHDGGRREPIKGVFCSKACREAYHG